MVFAFLGSPRSVLIPIIAIPLSLIGTFTMMLAFGFSINLLTLLALVLAIGLVVDDAIIVVENVNRHLEEGMRPIPAAIQAARELAGPIIAMTVVLIAVYVPIGFQGGLTGALFTEFAFTLVGAVTVSAVIALTLSPMMCLAPAAAAHRRPQRLGGAAGRTSSTGGFDVAASALRAPAARQPEFPAGHRWCSRRSCWAASISSIPAPPANWRRRKTRASIIAVCDPGAERDAAAAAAVRHADLQDLPVSFPETDHVFQLDVPGQNIAGMVLKPWDQRTRTTNQLQPLIQQALGNIAGLAHRRVPAAAAAGFQRLADPVRHRHDAAIQRAQHVWPSSSCKPRSRAGCSSSSTADLCIPARRQTRSWRINSAGAVGLPNITHRVRARHR